MLYWALLLALFIVDVFTLCILNIDRCKFVIFCAVDYHRISFLAGAGSKINSDHFSLALQIYTVMEVLSRSIRM